MLFRNPTLELVRHPSSCGGAGGGAALTPNPAPPRHPNSAGTGCQRRSRFPQFGRSNFSPAFTSANIDKILALKPNLVLTFSDPLQPSARDLQPRRDGRKPRCLVWNQLTTRRLRRPLRILIGIVVAPVSPTERTAAWVSLTRSPHDGRTTSFGAQLPLLRRLSNGGECPAFRPSCRPADQTPGPLRRRSNWDEPPPDWCSARR